MIVDSYDKCRHQVNLQGETLQMSDKNKDKPKKTENKKTEEPKLEELEELEEPEKQEEKQEQETPATSDKTSEAAPSENELAEIRSDVNKLSDDLQTTVTDLKKSIVDIRSAVSEIENPFNLLRTISSEKDLKKLNGERLPPGAKSLIVGKPQETAAAPNEINEEPPTEDTTPQPQPSPEPELQPQTPPNAEPEEVTSEKVVPVKVQSKPPKDSSAYLDWIWGLLDSGLKPSDIQQLACSCEFMGYLPAQTNEFIYSLAVAAEKFRVKGLTKGHMLLNLYKAASISKVKVGWEDMEALIAITDNQLKTTKKAKGVE